MSFLLRILKKIYSTVVPLKVRNIVFHRILKRGCTEAELIFVEHVEKLKSKSMDPIICAEIGVDKGFTTREVLGLLSSGDQFDLFDREASVLFQKRIKDVPDGVTLNYFSNSNYPADSYAWTLAKKRKEGAELSDSNLIYDIIFLDGAHTFHIDATATCYLKEMLKIGGTILFSDMSWKISESYTANTRRARKMYPKEQLETPHIELIVDTLVRNDKRFKELDSSDPDVSVFERVEF